MKTIGFLACLAALALSGCNTGDTPIQTYKPAPGQVTNPSAPPAQAGAATSMQDAIQSNQGMPQAAKDALLRGKK